MDAKQLYASCLAGLHRTKYTITGNTIIKFAINPYLVWCDLFAPPEERDQKNSYIDLLFSRGIDHEKKVFASLFPQAKTISLTTFEEGFLDVLNNCFQGTEVMSGAPLFYLSEGLQGILDVMQRDESHPSIFGNYHYRIKEIKSAKHIKREYILQGAFYTYLLGKIQKYTPPTFTLINRDGEEFQYSYEKYEQELQLCITEIKEIFNGKKISPTAKACRWPWETYCNKQAQLAQDVSIVGQVGPVLKKKLNALGITTVAQLANTPIPLDLPPAVLQNLRNHAKAWTEQKCIVTSIPKLAQTNEEIFLDFEGTDELPSEEGMIKVVYLIGVLLRNPKEHFRPFVAETLGDEGRMFHEFLEYVRQYPNAPLYHYGHYEKMHLKILGEKYKTNVSDVLKRMVDILLILKKSVALPLLTMSLKEVGKYLQYNWRGMADAQESIVLYNQFIETRDRELLHRILNYNEDDVRATAVVKDFLASL